MRKKCEINPSDDRIVKNHGLVLGGGGVTDNDAGWTNKSVGSRRGSIGFDLIYLPLLIARLPPPPARAYLPPIVVAALAATQRPSLMNNDEF